MRYVQYAIAVIMLGIAVGAWGFAIGLYTHMIGVALLSRSAAGRTAEVINSTCPVYAPTSDIALRRTN